MSHRFDPRASLVVVAARLWGPTGSTLVRLALDTGAMWTVLTPHLLGLDFFREQRLFIDFRAGTVSLESA